MKYRSIRNMGGTLFVLVGSILIVLFSLSISQYFKACAEEKTRIEHVLENMQTSIENRLNRIENFLSYQMLESDELYRINLGEDATSAYIDKLHVFNNMGSFMIQNGDISLIAVYCSDTEEYISRFANQQNSTVAYRIQVQSKCRDFLVSQMYEEETVPQSWVLRNFGDDIYLCREFCFHGITILGAVKVADILSWGESFLSDGGSVSFAAEQIETVDNSWNAEPENTTEIQIRLSNSKIFASVPFCGERFLVQDNRDAALRRNAVLILVICLTSIIMFLGAIGMYYAWRKHVIEPLNELQHTMENIREGNLKSRFYDKNAGNELRSIGETFNNMMEQIEVLKIESYEKELQAKQNQLQFYRLQIRPHFYLNCLKNLYALTTAGNLAVLEDSILRLSEYLRHTFTKNMNGVTLANEVEQCKNYIALFGISSRFPPELEATIDNDTQKIIIPSISLLTFVENSLKHTPSGQQVIHISIRAKQMLLENTSYLHITVSDDGPGFSEKLLMELNRTDWKAEEVHVGISNVMNRLALLYPGESHILFSNQPGATIELFIPVSETEVDA